MIDLLPNETIVFQWVIFMIAFLILHFGIFRPTLKIIEERKTKTIGEKDTARHLENEFQKMKETFERRMEEARLEGIKRKDTLRLSGESFVEDLLKKTRGEIDQQMEQTRAEIEGKTKEAALQLRQQARGLGHEIAVRILERDV